MSKLDLQMFNEEEKNEEKPEVAENKTTEEDKEEGLISRILQKLKTTEEEKPEVATPDNKDDEKITLTEEELLEKVEKLAQEKTNKLAKKTKDKILTSLEKEKQAFELEKQLESELKDIDPKYQEFYLFNRTKEDFDVEKFKKENNHMIIKKSTSQNSFAGGNQQTRDPYLESLLKKL